MGFKSLLDKQVQGVMKTLGQNDGLAPVQTYVQITADAYNPVTRTNTPTEVRHTGVPMVLARFAVDEIDNDQIVTTDLKAIIASLDLPVEPQEDDVVEIATANAGGGPVGSRFLVMKNMGVPGNSVHILQLRRTT